MSALRCPKCGKDGVTKGGHSRGKQRWMCGDKVGCKWHGTNPVGEIVSGIDRKATAAKLRAIKADRRPVRRYLITSAQNATPVHQAALDNMLHYCEVNDAVLIVIPYRYKNPTSQWSEKAENDDWWDPKLTPFLLDRRVMLNPNLMVLADIKTQPTAESPLSGFETITGGKSAIIGHPRLELTTVATPQNAMAKILTSTGAITQRNYLPSKAGKKGEFHHTFGACLVELVGSKTFHMRQINCLNDGSFMDLRYEYRDGDHQLIEGDTALVMGDSHIDFMDPEVRDATFGENGILNYLKPKYVVWHDVNDFYARNHHESKNVIGNLVRHQTGRGNVEAELDRTFAFIDVMTHDRPWQTNVFVSSNHANKHLSQWVNDTDPRQDVENCVFWAKTFQAMAEAAHMTEHGHRTIDPFAYWGKKKLSTRSRARFLGSDESFSLHGIEMGYHGDHGPNGSRGTKRSFNKIGVKTITGHVHSPGILNGSYFAGTSTYLKLGYTHGPSSWMHTHVYVYPNGKRTLINIVKGEWKA